MPSWDLPKEVKYLFKVLEIRQINGYDFPNDLNYLMISIRKSALFQRLMEGKEPLPIPPPRAFSYPWYSLIDDGYGYPFEVWKAEDNLFGFPAVGIDQSVWKLEQELGEDNFIVSYFYGKDNANLSDTKWHVYPVGCRVPQNSFHKSSNYLWKIEKVEESSYIKEELDPRNKETQ